MQQCFKIPLIMKKGFAFVALGLIMTVMISSYKHWKNHKPCESYGNKSGSVEQFPLNQYILVDNWFKRWLTVTFVGWILCFVNLSLIPCAIMFNAF